jgi:hypothetical protein
MLMRAPISIVWKLLLTKSARPHPTEYNPKFKCGQARDGLQTAAGRKPDTGSSQHAFTIHSTHC